MAKALTPALHEFCAAFAEQDPGRLLAVFDTAPDVSFVASEDLILRDRSTYERFVAGYCGQDVSFSFEWDSVLEQVSGDHGWILAVGREVRHAHGHDTPADFRMTLVCRRTAAGWRIVHLHASTPVG